MEDSHGRPNGQVAVKKNTSGATPNVDANLFDFTNGESTLKPKHIEHLVNDVIPALKQNGKAKAKLIGSADASGEGLACRGEHVDMSPQFCAQARESA
jgi:hypothetical protein